MWPLQFKEAHYASSRPGPIFFEENPVKPEQRRAARERTRLFLHAADKDTPVSRAELAGYTISALDQIDADEGLMRKVLEAAEAGGVVCFFEGCQEPYCSAFRLLRARLGEGAALKNAAKGPNLSTDANLLDQEPELLREITFTAPPFNSHHEEAGWALLARFGLEMDEDEPWRNEHRFQLRRASVALVLATLYRGQVHSRPNDVLERKAQHYACAYEDEIAKIRLGEAPAPEKP